MMVGLERGAEVFEGGSGTARGDSHAIEWSACSGIK
jgi:hypothetical protein